MVAADQQGGADYEIGYKRPPKSGQFQPGQRANPRGRPRGSPNKKTQVEQALNKKVSVRKGNKTSKLPILQAMTEVFALQAVQGDRHAANVVINLATKSGVFREDQTSNLPSGQIESAREMRLSDQLLEGIDSNLLSKEEQIELSKLAERIDIGRDVTALSDDEFASWKQIVNKGRGKDVPREDGREKAP